MISCVEFHFTSSNKQQGTHKNRKLDKVLLNGAWLQRNSSTTIEFLAPKISDHCPAVVTLSLEAGAGRRPFKFYNYWTQNLDFLSGSRCVAEKSFQVALSRCCIRRPDDIDVCALGLTSDRSAMGMFISM